jgi:hypothetical protein
MIGQPRRLPRARRSTLDGQPNPRASTSAGGADQSDGRDRPPRLGEQFAATRGAAVRLAKAHIDLARAEFGAITAEIQRVAVLGGIAFSLLLFAFMLLPIGLTLFLGEWIFGSMGWGIVHGTELSILVAIILVLVALGTRRSVIGGSFLTGLVLGAIVAVVLALQVTNRGWTWLGDQVAGNITPDNRPLVVSVVTLAAVFGILGILIGLLSRSVVVVIQGLVIGILLGVGFGALTAVTLSVQVALAIGLAVGLLVWAGALGFLAFRAGLDFDALKSRFVPHETIDTTRETIEWIRQRVPAGRR